MMSEEVVPRVGQLGTVFTADVEEPNPAFDPSMPIGPGNLKYLPVDLTNATTVQIEFRKPNRTTVLKTAAVFGTPTDGKIRYTNTPGEGSIFDAPGLWRFRGVVEFSDSSKFPGSWYEQRVGK